MSRRRALGAVVAVAAAGTGGVAGVTAFAVPATASAGPGITGGGPSPANSTGVPSSAIDAAAAPVAAITVNHACYQLSQSGTLHGTGFDPRAAWSAKLDGKPFGSGKTSKHGTIQATFGAPSKLRKRSPGEETHTLVVNEGAQKATTTFLLTKLAATFAPTGGNLSTLKVHMRLFGWGAGSKVYLHYVSPKSKVRLDRSIGKATGACGDLVTAPLKLFPFRPTKGTWTLQFDTTAKYDTTAVPRVAIGYKVS